MKTINPYLNFPGNTEEAFNFYKSVFDVETLTLMRFKDTPEAVKVPDNEKDMVMHAALPVGNTVLMATDTLASMGQKLNPGNNFYLSVSADSNAEADKIFSGLSEGGKVTMPMSKQFWGAYFGMLIDKFGIHWMVSYSENQ